METSSPDSDLLTGLNEMQRRAVEHVDGPLLVLAGAGSGKTRVITHRVAHLVRHAGVQANRILAVTFTNKAAGEMRERVAQLLPGDGPAPWIGTFHSLCLRILRRDGEAIGLDPGFVIYDTDDQLAIVKRLLKEETGGDNPGSPRSFLSRISRAKNAMQRPQQLAKHAFSPDQKLTARVYERYDAMLRQANAVDFDDLLVRTLDLLATEVTTADGELRSYGQAYAERCEHLLVDEYQDTNRPQYKLIRTLTAAHGNVCAVGDEDQSIYRFRGAEIKNILDFERDYPETTTIRLEQNYRSTSSIIEAAGAVIAHNVARKGKTLWTENDGGDKLRLFRAPDDRAEAQWVAQQIEAASARWPYEQVAVLYRTNALSRLLEEVLRRERIPYQIVGSVQFYARKEIKDLLAYLMLAANPADDVAFRRAVNTPPRGVGATTVDTIESVARAAGLPMLGGARRALDEGALSSRPGKNVRAFVDYLDEVVESAEHDGVAGSLEKLVGDLKYEAYLEKSYPGQGAERMENVRALISAAVEFAEESDEDTLQAFLDHSALVAGVDEMSDRPGVTLMTIHCAKGLEFPCVYIVGMEENLFPHAMASGTDEDIEEERRLCYVAMTRAEQQLSLSHARFRRFQGALLPNPPSRFLDELPPALLEVEAPQARDAGFFGGGNDGSVRERSGGGSSAARAARQAASRPQAPSFGARTGAPVETPADGMAVAASVEHPRFGRGRIVGREGSGKHLKLTIEFSGYGTKKILPAYTQLTVIG